MQEQLYMKVLFCLPEEGFSLDELVIKTKELFEREGMSAFIRFILMFLDESLSIKLREGNFSLPCSCKDSCYVFHGYRKRRFRTSAGLVEIEWRRFRCKKCNKTIIPLQDFLGIDKYQSKTPELEKMFTEVVSEQSYRRTSSHFNIIGEIPIPKSTAHRWVMESDCDELRINGDTVDCLFVDGTGYKRRPAEDSNNRGELRVALGVRKDGYVFPFGAWSGSSWKEIGKELRMKKLHDGPLANVLISDGEPGLAEGLADLIDEQQRCHWHTVRDLKYMMWSDEANKKESCDMQSRLAGIIGIELPEEDFKKVSEDDKKHLSSSVKDAEQKLETLVSELTKKGYSKAANYVKNAKDKLFTYVRFFLKYGLVSKRTSSFIERIMREIGRRIKKIAFGWSQEGAAKMARIIIKRITSEYEWKKYWERRLNIKDNVFLLFKGVSLN